MKASKTTNNGFLAMYNGKRSEQQGIGLDLYTAKQQAIKELKVPRSKQYVMIIMLAEVNGEPVIHTPS